MIFMKQRNTRKRTISAGDLVVDVVIDNNKICKMSSISAFNLGVDIISVCINNKSYNKIDLEAINNIYKNNNDVQIRLTKNDISVNIDIPHSKTSLSFFIDLFFKNLNRNLYRLNTYLKRYEKQYIIETLI